MKENLNDALSLVIKAKEKLDELKKDERMYYPTATVFANAPLALIQCSIGAQINILENILGLPMSKFPLIK